MRQLGLGQSLHFFAQPEVDSVIRTTLNSDQDREIAIRDILNWSLDETCQDIAGNAMRWSQQGLDYHVRREAFDALTNAFNPADVDKVRSAWVQPEVKSLEELYGPKDASQQVNEPRGNHPSIIGRL